MTLARHVREAVAKLRDVPMTEHCGSCNGLDPAAVNRIADDLEHAARTHACETCATYRTVLDLCVGEIPEPSCYGDLPGWVAQLVAVAEAARKLREIEIARAGLGFIDNAKHGLGAQWSAQDALDAALAKVGK